MATAKRAQPEEYVQKRLVALLREMAALGGNYERLNVCMFHVSNEGMLPVQYRAKLRAKGLDAGQPDLHIVAQSDVLYIGPLVVDLSGEYATYGQMTDYRVETPPGIVMELKAHGGTLSDAQRDRLSHYASEGWLTVLLRARSNGHYDLEATAGLGRDLVQRYLDCKLELQVEQRGQVVTVELPPVAKARKGRAA